MKTSHTQDHDHKRLKKKLWLIEAAIFVLAMLLAGASSAQNVTIPDNNFKTALVSDFTINTNMDSEISVAEAVAVTGTLDISSNNIADLTGIEAFTAITGLQVSSNDLTSLDLSSNTALTFVDAGGNDLTSVDLTQNTLLSHLELDYNNLTSIDLTQNVGLTFLQISFNQLTTINLTQNTSLTDLICGNGQISSLDLSQNTALVDVNLQSSQLTSLDITQNTNLIGLSIWGNQISSLDLSQNTLLEDLNIGNNLFTSIDISNNTALTDFSSNDNQLTSIDLSQNTQLVELDVTGNMLNSLDLSQNTQLTGLFAYDNLITSLDLSQNLLISDIDIITNQITSLDLSQHTNLEYVDVSENLITSLDVSQSTSLEYFYAYSNNLTDLNVASGNNTFISEFEVTDNPYLTCIQVDDVAYSTANWTDIDAGVTFSLDCPEPFITTWKTDNTGTSNDDQITIPINAFASTGFTIDWGDGNVTQSTLNNPTHTYSTPGTYTVTMFGDFQRLSFDDGGDKEKLLTIEQWGDIQWTSMDRAFRGCSNLVVNASDAPDLSSVTSMQMMFFGASSFNSSIDHWDVSNVTNMSFVFTAASSFNQPLNSWDVSSVTTMSSMFSSAPAFNQPLDNWTTTSLTNTSFMFSNADAFNQPINNWDVSEVIFMSNMFAGNNAFNQPLDSWDVSKVTDMTRMFNLASEFDQPLGSWDVSGVTLMNDMLNNTALSPSNYDDLLTGWSVLTLQNGVRLGASGVTYCNGASARLDIINNFSWIISDFGQNCPPSISTLSPPDDETNVSISTDLIITFDENVQTGSGNVFLKRVSDDLLIQSYSSTDDEVTISGSEVTINPVDLTHSTEVYVEIEAGAFQDLSGNDFEGLNKPDWSFTSEDPDTTPPTISSLAPGDDATNVGISDNLIMTFSEDVQGTGTGLIRIKNGSGTTKENFILPNPNVTFSGNTVTINPTSDLNYNSDYYMEIPNDGIEDLSGNDFAGISDNTTWNFTTEPIPDADPPTISTLTPSDDATSVGIGDNLIMIFNEDVQNTSTGLIRIKNGNGTTKENFSLPNPNVTFSGNTVTINPTVDLAYNSDYYMEIPNDGIEDLAGNNFAGISDNTTWNFTTEPVPDLTPPSVTSFNPVDNSVDIDLNATFTVTFNEDVQAGSGAIKVKRVSDDVQISLFNVSLSGVTFSGNTVSFMPFAGAATHHNTEFYIEIPPGAIEDLSGNPYAGFEDNTTWTVTTVDLSPHISTLSPSNGATDVTVNSNFVIDFDKTVTKGTGSISFRNQSDDIAVFSVIVTSPEVSISGSTVTINPTNELPYATDLYVAFSSSVFRSPEGVNGDEVVKGDWNFTTTKEDQTITFGSLSVKTYGDASFNLTGTASSGLAVEYSSSDLSVATISGNVVTVVGAGTTTITASQVGNGQYNPAVEVMRDLVVNKAPLTATADDKTKTYGDPNPGFSLSFTGFVNGEVSSVLDILPNVSTTATAASDVGDYTLTVAGGSDNNYEYNHVNGTLTINKADLMITADDKTKVFGETIPALTMSFDGFVNGDNQSDLDLVPVPMSSATMSSNVGTYDIDLIGGSDNNYAYSLTSGTLTITKADQVITIDPIADKITTDVPFDVTASTTSGLTLDYSITSGPANISGNTITLTGTSGTVQVNVSQAGNGNYNSANESISFNVSDPAKTDQTITFDAITDKVFGESFALNASASSGLEVSFSVVSGPVNLSGSNATITGVGTATIAANQEGDGSFNPAMEVTRTFNIAKADQVITISAIADKLTTDGPFDVSATVDSGLELDYTISGPASIVGTTITLDGSPGTITVTVDQVGNENYNAASELISFEVSDPTKMDQSITFTSISDKTFGDVAFELEGSASSGLSLEWSVVNGPVVIDDGEVTINGAGEATIAANQPGNDDYNAATEVTQTFTIHKADQVIAIEAVSDKFTTDEAFEITATVDSELELTYEVSGPATINGTLVTLDGSVGTVTVTVSQAGNENYNAVSEVLSFEVTEESALSVDESLVSVKFYPNPVKEILFIESNEKATLRLFDLQGKMIKQDLSYSKQLDVRDVTPGVYLLEIVTDSNVTQQRIVKAN